ncbi:Crp/Fnr family transcriptional regulator [Bacteroidia bacterium]|nr:Crp/Fnr family transcriptional regulator [Bacteroidia bacterium]
MNDFRIYLEKHLSISDADWDIIKRKFKSDNCTKGVVLSPLGKVENKLYFLLSGALRLYYELETKDVTINIGFPMAFMSSYTSYLSRMPSDFILESLTPCTYLCITHHDLLEIYQQTDCGQELGRILTEQLFLYLSHRENAFMLKSPTQRYLDLFEEQPRLIQEIPQKYLASYIGITPQALSRIRAKLVQRD